MGGLAHSPGLLAATPRSRRGLSANPVCGPLSHMAVEESLPPGAPRRDPQVSPSPEGSRAKLGRSKWSPKGARAGEPSLGSLNTLSQALLGGVSVRCDSRDFPRPLRWPAGGSLSAHSALVLISLLAKLVGGAGGERLPRVLWTRKKRTYFGHSVISHCALYTPVTTNPGLQPQASSPAWIQRTDPSIPRLPGDHICSAAAPDKLPRLGLIRSSCYYCLIFKNQAESGF